MMRKFSVVSIVIRKHMIVQRHCQQQTRILPIKAFIAEVKSHTRFEKIGCLDYGMKCIGIATTDETKEYAFPFGAFFVKQPPKTTESLQDLHRQLQDFCVKENIRYQRGLLKKMSMSCMRYVSCIALIPDSLEGTLLLGFP